VKCSAFYTFNSKIDSPPSAKLMVLWLAVVQIFENYYHGFKKERRLTFLENLKSSALIE